MNDLEDDPLIRGQGSDNFGCSISIFIIIIFLILIISSLL